MKSFEFLVIVYTIFSLGGTQEDDSNKSYTFPTRLHHLQNIQKARSVRSIHTPPLYHHNRSNHFIAAGQGAFPNCQIYGRTYCTEIEGYPE